jgi:hypothetical protein
VLTVQNMKSVRRNTVSTLLKGIVSTSGNIASNSEFNCGSEVEGRSLFKIKYRRLMDKLTNSNNSHSVSLVWFFS